MAEARQGFLLDSSGWLAHLFGEPGEEQVTALLCGEKIGVSISTLSLVELHGRLSALGREKEWPALWTDYRTLFAGVIPVSEDVAQRAIALRAASVERLPMVDSLIAATAAVHGLTLVHRDPHLGQLPQRLVRQTVLPGRS